MKIVSLNAGVPRTVLYKGRYVKTAIFKEPVAGPARVRRHNLDGDAQADLNVHGGATKAVYAYPSEHYGFWKSELPGMDLPWGMFGENLTLEGLLEQDVRVGDRFRVGSAILRVTEPRVPCAKLALRFDREDMPKRFLRSGRTGFYFAVDEEGDLCAGDAIEAVSRDPGAVSIPDLVELYRSKDPDQDLLRRAVETPGLSGVWLSGLRRRLEALGSGSGEQRGGHNDPGA